MSNQAVCIVRQTSQLGKIRWIENIKPLEFTRIKKKAHKFNSYDEAMLYINEVGIDFYGVEELD